MNFLAVATHALCWRAALLTRKTKTMGQAKQRGTFEDRRQQSIARTEAERLERQRKESEWWNSLTDEQKENVRRNRARRARQMAFFTAFSWRAFLP